MLKTPENFFSSNKFNDLRGYAPPKINSRFKFFGEKLEPRILTDFSGVFSINGLRKTLWDKLFVTTQGNHKGLPLQQYSFGEFLKYSYVGAIPCGCPELP